MNQSERGGVGMVIDEVGVRRTATGAARNGNSGNLEDLIEKPKEKPSKKSKSKSAKKNGKSGTPPGANFVEHPHLPEPSERAEATLPAEITALIDHFSGEAELTGPGGASTSTLTIDEETTDVDELMCEEPAQPPVPETGDILAEIATVDASMPSKDEAPASRRQRALKSKVVPIAGGALIVALAIILTLSLMALNNQNALASSRASALSAARTYAVELASYNYRDLHHDFSTVAANSTPSFRRTFDESSNALKSTLSRYKATAEASVESAGVVSASTSRAVLLVFLDQKIANSTQTKPTTDRSQVEVTVVRSGSRWLIDQVKLL